MKYLICIVYVSVIACGKSEPRDIREDHPELSIDESLVSYVSEWRENMDNSHVDYHSFDRIVSIKEEELPSPKLGLCTVSSQGRTIKVVPGLYGKVLQAVVYHELGHCALNQDHWPINGAIMNAYLLKSQSYWADGWDGLVKEYKDGVKQGQYHN